MADKRIQDLTAATAINNSDNFVLEQNGVAKKLAGSVLKSYAQSAVPTNVSFFTNDAGYLTLSTLPVYGGDVS